MRLTVGPLPAAVYWRRRALVLGIVLLLVLLAVYSCGGSDGKPTGGDATPTSQPGPDRYPSEEPSADPTESPDTSGSGSGSDGVGDGSGDADPGAFPGGDDPGADVPVCADGDLSIKPKPAHTRTPEGARLTIHLVITNVSDRPCERDIGADQQELRLMQGKQRIWSSDDCNPQRGSLVEVLPPDEPIQRFWVAWDGRTSAPECAGERRVVGEGRYSLLARLGELISEPVTLTVVAT